ncbi:MAG: DUF2785 domain-containing protein [Propionibacteriaceae bacterium]|jgi:hypothetical protein|nr:DUF2785 domain-containing protein [Propionibacteriaceae bacterium]
MMRKDAEIGWMMDNIGAEDPHVRDDVIYMLLTNALKNETLTEEQFRLIADTLVDQQLVFHHMTEALPAVLTRSFAALQSGNLIEADGTVGGRYHHLLTAAQRYAFFRWSLSYLDREHCYEGLSAECGWVHAFAHGGDYLACAIAHPSFPSDLVEQVLTTLSGVFHRLGAPFVQGEERRLGEVIVAGIVSGNLTQSQVTRWLTRITFALEGNRDYQRLATFEVFLAYIYFHLLDKIGFEDGFKSALLGYLKEI